MGWRGGGGVQSLLLKQREILAYSHVWLVFLFPTSDASPLAALVLHLVGLVVFAAVSSR